MLSLTKKELLQRLANATATFMASWEESRERATLNETLARIWEAELVIEHNYIPQVTDFEGGSVNGIGSSRLFDD